MSIENTQDRNPAVPAEQFWSQVRKEPDPAACWPWRGARMGGTHNYGQLRSHGRTFYAHRTSYELHHGPIPPGFYVLHSCDNPPCVNPGHLRAGTAADNSRDMRDKGRARGRVSPGSENGWAKLDELKVVTIRGLAASGARQTEIAAAFGVTQANVSMIVRRETWKHVPEDAVPEDYIAEYTAERDKYEAVAKQYAA